MAIIGKLFITFGAIYGATFVKNFGEQDVGTWCDILHGVKKSQFNNAYRAITELKSDFITYPPNALQFKALCLRNELAGACKLSPGEYSNKTEVYNMQIGESIKQSRKDFRDKDFTVGGLLSGEELRGILTPQEVGKARNIFNTYAKFTPYLFCMYCMHCLRSSGNIHTFCAARKIRLEDYE